MIRIRNLHKTYQVDGRAVTALRDINLEIGRGKFLALLAVPVPVKAASFAP